ncbi:hypothetical protein HPB51_003192 [Rhipicephalus microplus]|uniref:Serine carboxypeptidase n=1 Tax=Rhipicephalus microplus TaxID=6941 RepID=A0A9J6EKA2_RHIMP|nr:hypothetical protein HPB51_003192 [Rhipicephalus microplus]
MRKHKGYCVNHDFSLAFMHCFEVEAVDEKTLHRPEIPSRNFRRAISLHLDRTASDAMRLWTFIGVALATASLVGSQGPPGDQILFLPGLSEQPSFKQYSGFLNAGATRKMFYWFVASQETPEKDPLLLWLDAGPGCSSMVTMFKEHGPFRVADNGKSLVENAYSWNKLANVLYLEAPASVGFSYDLAGNYTSNDDSTGYAIGNGALDFPSNGNSLLLFGQYHGILDPVTWNQLLSSCCNGSASEETCSFVEPPFISVECETAVEIAAHLIIERGLNNNDLYDKCVGFHPNQESGSKMERGTQYATFITPHLRAQQLVLRSLNIKAWRPNNLRSNPPCVTYDDVATYLNQPQVRKALHSVDSPMLWTPCSDRLLYATQYITLGDVVKKLIDSGKLKSLFYNGDTDLTFNVVGNQMFVDSLGYEVLSEYKPWKLRNQVAGYYQAYKGNVTFVTIKVANILFLDAPAGSGYSYDATGNYATDDDQAADDTYLAILDFYHKFTLYGTNDLYVIGQGQAATHVTLVVERLLEEPTVKLRGYAINNGILDNRFRRNGLIFFGYYHGLFGRSGVVKYKVLYDDLREIDKGDIFRRQSEGPVLLRRRRHGVKLSRREVVRGRPSKTGKFTVFHSVALSGDGIPDEIDSAHFRSGAVYCDLATLKAG